MSNYFHKISINEDSGQITVVFYSKPPSLKPYKIRVSRVDYEFLILSAYFSLTYTFTLGKWVFFGLFSLHQNPKIASCKSYRVSGRSKKAKKNVVPIFQKLRHV